LSAINTDAVRVPIAFGWKVTLIVQFAPAANELPQVLLSLKSDGFVPLREILLMLNDALPRLVSVTVFAVVVCPTATGEKNVMLDADSFTCGRRPKMVKVDLDPTYTFPFAIVGTVNLTAPPGTSRLFGA
jgi:hypothetical protein